MDGGKKLTSAKDHVSGEMLSALLEENGIASYRVDRESGGYMRLFMGYSIFGEDIYVSEKDYERAAQLLRELEGREGFAEEEEIYRKPRTAARVIILATVLCWVLLTLVSWIFGN